MTSLLLWQQFVACHFPLILIGSLIRLTIFHIIHGSLIVQITIRGALIRQNKTQRTRGEEETIRNFL